MTGILAPDRRRRAVATPQEWVRVRPLTTGSALPMLVEPTVQGIDLPEWAQGLCGHFQKVMLGVMLVGGATTIITAMYGLIGGGA